jgi:hypothetical protein
MTRNAAHDSVRGVGRVYWTLHGLRSPGRWTFWASGRAVSTLLLTVLALSAHAEPPKGVTIEPGLHAWFERQHNANGGWCCDLADGHILTEDQWRGGTKGYEVLIAGRWWPIEPWMYRNPIGGPNPTGQAIVWYTDAYDGPRIWCFTPGTEG